MEPHKSNRKDSKLDLKGKGIAMSPEKPKKNRSKIDEIPRRKRKFLVDTTIEAKKVKVEF